MDGRADNSVLKLLHRPFLYSCVDMMNEKQIDPKDWKLVMCMQLEDRKDEYSR